MQGQIHPLSDLQLAGWLVSANITEAGVSKSTRNLLLAAWRKSTSDVYASAWRKWASWCSQRQINPLQADVSAILEFLALEYEAGKAYRTLNVYWSAISMTHPRADSFRVGEHPLVKQLLRGIFNSRPPLTRYSGTWDVQKALTYMESLGTMTFYP